MNAEPRQPPDAPPGVGSASAVRRSSFLLPLAFALWFVVRFVYDGLRQLVPDEAYYWVWSRHLAPGYFDHPPVIAYAIRAGTALLGQTELGVRASATVMTLGAAILLTWAAHRWRRDARVTTWTAIILLTSPALAVLGTVVAPDTPACFFSAAALAVAIEIFRQDDGQRVRANVGPPWLLFGLFLGLALASKYTSVLLGVAVLAAMLSSRGGRSHLRRPWPWMGAGVALLVFSPVIYWNATHGWASFGFQLRHGMGPRDPDDPGPAFTFLQYLAGQAFVWTPVLFVASVVVLGIYWRRLWRGDLGDMVGRVLLFAATLPLLFFAYSSLKRKVEPNWPVFAYLPATLLLVKYVAETGSPRRRKWLRIGVIVAACGTLVLHVPEAMWAGGIKVGSKWDDLFGWRDLGAEADRVRREAGRPPLPLFAYGYQDASELSFYTPGRPDVWSLPGGRPTAFDYLSGKPDLSIVPEAVFVGKFAAPPDPAYEVVALHRWEAWKMGRFLRFRNLIVARRRTSPEPASRRRSADE